MITPYLGTKEESIKDFNPKTETYEMIEQLVIHLFDSLGEKSTYRFNKKSEINKFHQTKKEFEKLIKNKEI